MSLSDKKEAIDRGGAHSIVGPRDQTHDSLNLLTSCECARDFGLEVRFRGRNRLHSIAANYYYSLWDLKRN